ncbi:hypothetical protein M9H77_30319 [Catharanthus roseus]|uniref:Uncharacterized protein n=1 Tax=Catharanthus roseus TaxID=4058 RepID=A0ACB9ZZI8_CATRO|nr:hypothetical protein M9H77_30319 [Catharanthus roseus]
MQTLVKVRMLKKEKAAEEEEKEKRVPSGVTAPDIFISMKEVTKFDEWTRKRRKIPPGHRVKLNDMEGMEIIPNLFNNIGWTPLLIVNELFYPEMIYKVYANFHKLELKKLEIYNPSMGTLGLVEGTLLLMIGDQFWFYGHRAYASYTILMHRMFAVWLLPYEDLSIFCAQLDWSR